MIDQYELRRRFDDLKYRLTLIPRRTLVMGGLVILLIPVAFAIVFASLSGPPAGNAEADAKFRARSRQAIESAEGKADLTRLAAMNDADLRKEVQSRQKALNDIDRSGKLTTTEGEAAWGSLLRASQMQRDRARKAPKKDDP